MRNFISLTARDTDQPFYLHLACIEHFHGESGGTYLRTTVGHFHVKESVRDVQQMILNNQAPVLHIT